MSQTPNNRSTSEFINLSTPPQTEGRSDGHGDGLSETAVANLLSMSRIEAGALAELLASGLARRVDLSRLDEAPTEIYNVVGPICETGDFLGKNRELGLAEGDLLAVRSAGAYGFTMSSNYNARPRAAEVLVDGSEVHLVRARESLASLYAGESVLPA